MLNKIEELTEKVAAGEKPVVKFNVIPELTKEMTAVLYKWILCCHLYMFYEAIQEALKANEYLPNQEIADIVERKDPEKVKRRYRVL